MLLEGVLNSGQSFVRHQTAPIFELTLLALHNVTWLERPALIFRRLADYAECAIRQLLSFCWTPAWQPII